MAQRATSLGPKPSLFSFCFFVFLFLLFVFLKNRKNLFPPPPLKKGIFVVQSSVFPFVSF